MTNEHRVNRYTTRFHSLAFLIGNNWSECTYRNQYYGGLASRIINRFASAGEIPPTGLEALITHAEALDEAYWTKIEHDKIHSPETKKSATSSSDRKKDKAAATTTTSSATTSSSGSTSGKSSSKTPSRGGSAPKESSPTRGKTLKPGNPSNSGSSSKLAYSSKLGSDGKLTAEERQRRLAEGLCLYCGGPGHLSLNCPIRKEKAAARAAQLVSRAVVTIQEETPK